jgi:gp178|nr:MAG TPA: Protein of unknown function (DUF1642) [Caudoviricetes sp.]
MNRQELIKHFEELPYVSITQMGKKSFIDLIEQLDEPETGHADEAPRYVKNILARLRELPAHDREVWLKAIMGEFKQDFSSAKWREGYEQGKFEGKYIPEKVAIPKFVADWIRKCKTFKSFFVSLSFALQPSVWEANGLSHECIEWLADAENQETFARAWLDGYEAEEEKRYKVRMKYIENNMKYIVFGKYSESWFLESENESSNIRTNHTRKELEEAGFGWVFDCEGVEVQEVG